ncbi:MAG: dihydrofolate reductase family protein [Actinomycetales bacterium]|nr:dihydrofolate reductase family protein [Actinomycetales bacterium]
MAAEIWSNFVVAANGATALRGCSSALSSPEDRIRFHAYRNSARAIITGGNTFRGEPYDLTPVPLYVATRDKSTASKNRNPKATFLNLSPEKVIERALEECGGPVLVEGGKSFLQPLLDQSFIQRVHVTRTDRDGDDIFWNIDDSLLRYQLSKVEIVGAERFEIWNRRD